MLFYILLICLFILQIYFTIKLDRHSSYFIFPANNYIVIFNTAVGEEFIFRILPHLICQENIGIRIIFSSIVFGLLHGLSFSELISEKNLTVINGMTIGLFLILIEDIFSSPIHWYIACCMIHGFNNVLFVHNNNNKKFVYSSGIDKRFITVMCNLS